MREVVYFDSNPSIRALIAGKLKKMGLKVILPNQLNEIEQALQACVTPYLLIADLSREPQFLRALQSFVSQYVSNPGRCIITSIRPTALAHYLPSDLDRCFFKHVVERPFKTPEFMALIESEFPPGTLLTNSNASIVNSSVDQITLPPNIVEHTEEKERVNEIMRSISMPISISEAGASEQAAACKHADRRSIVVSQAELAERASAPDSDAAIPKSPFAETTDLPPLAPPTPQSAYPTHQPMPSVAPQSFVQPEPLPPLPPLAPACAVPQDPMPETAPVSHDELLAAPSQGASHPYAQSSLDSQPGAPRPLVPNRISRKHGHATAAQPHVSTAQGFTRHDPRQPSNPDVKRLPIRSAKSTLDAIRGTSSLGATASKDGVQRVPSRFSQIVQRSVSPSRQDLYAALQPDQAPSPSRPACDSIHDVFANDAHIHELDDIDDDRLQNADPDPIEQDDVSAPHHAETLPPQDFDDDDEIEHTMLISPETMSSAIAPESPSLKITPCASGMLSVYVWCDILRRSCLTGERMTLEIGNPTKTSIVIVDMGSALWAESCTHAGPQKFSAYLDTLPDAFAQTVQRLKPALRPDEDPSHAMMTLNVYDQLIPAFEKTLVDTLKSVVATTLVSYKCYDGLSKKADALLKDRLPLNLPIAPFIFEHCRELKLPLGAAQFRKFRARPERSPLNAAIQLDELEKNILSMLASPQTCEFLDAALHEDVSAVLPRLILFDFVDISA